ncbi:hypothetical protein RCJ22_05835, partial [Vibrio sp. FNV 38]|nr:hypothetical protein [Vibrio sp. FNV 38]
MTDSPHLGFFVPEYEKLHRSVSVVTKEQFGQLALSKGEIPGSEFVMILSSELRCEDATYIEDMMSCMHFQSVGAVTGKIIGRGGKIESAGFIRNADNTQRPEYAGLNRRFSGYLHRASIDRLTGG